MTAGRPKSLLLGNDARAIEILLSVHHPAARDIADVTFGGGVMWKGNRWVPTWKSDTEPKAADVRQADCRALPTPDESFDVVVFDPPHLPAAVASANSANTPHKRYYGLTAGEAGDWRQGDNVSPLFAGFLTEAARVLRPNGVALVKIIDLIHNHRYQWQHVDLIVAVGQVPGLTPCDLLVLGHPAAGNIQSSKWQHVHHLRRGHCYWVVIRKGRCETSGAWQSLPPSPPAVEQPGLFE